MDSDTRHQLKQNELADALAKLRDWNNPSTRYTILGLAALAVIIVGVYTFRSLRQSALETTSAELGRLAGELNSTEPAQITAAIGKLQTLIADTSNPGLVGAARLTLARAQFDQGLHDPNQRPQAFKNAADTYNAILKTSTTPPMTEAAAWFGLATACESLHDLDQAKSAYEKLTDPRFQGSPYVPLAAEHLSSIDDLKVQVTLTPGLPPGGAAPAGTTPGAPPSVQLAPVSDPAVLAELNKNLPAPAPGPTPPAPAPQQPEQPPTPPSEPKPAEPAPAPTPAPAPAPETPQTP
jgi:hypothetical protein